MAKAKKSKGGAEGAAGSKPAGKKAAQNKPAPPPVDLPTIDTNLAAATAAKLLVHKDDLASAGATGHGESQSFKQLKESLHKPGGQNTPAFLQPPPPNKKFSSGKFGQQQIGRNQTFGADVNRSGVPRRTGG